MIPGITVTKLLPASVTVTSLAADSDSESSRLGLKVTVLGGNDIY